MDSVIEVPDTERLFQLKPLIEETHLSYGSMFDNLEVENLEQLHKYLSSRR